MSSRLCAVRVRGIDFGRLFGLFALGLLLCRVEASAAAPTVASTFENQIELRTWRNEAISRAGSQTVSGTQIGNENQVATCRNALIRRSGAKASASAKASDAVTSNDGLTITEIQLNANTTATGGGYRTCDACLGVCIGLHPHDTDALARASASAKTAFDAQGTSLEITARRISASNGEVSLRIVDDNDNILVEKMREGERYSLAISVGRKIIVQSSVAVVSANIGTCCSDSRAIQASVELAARVAEGKDGGSVQLAARARPTPRIVGGHVETGYPEVGIILIDNGASICTGTLVGPQTVLTAAHCVQGKSPYASRIKFLVLSDLVQRAAENTYTVLDAIYPSDMKTGFAYDNLIYADDIALVYLASQPRDPTDPKHEKLLAPITLFKPPANGLDGVQGDSLIFVGFGLASSPNKAGARPKEGEMTTKRSVSMQMARISRKTFRNEAQGQNTCRGDSGGPALYLGQGAPQIVGVVSSGDDGCMDYGNNTRVDAYATWLQGKIR